MSGLNQFLDGLAQSGAVDSSGEFTVSLSAARDKLEKFRLLDPNLFVLNLVSAALLGGASRLEISYDAKGATFTFDGQRYSTDQLRLLFVSDEPAHQELAIALTAAKALEPTRLLFQSGGGIQWEQDSHEMVPGIEADNVLTLQQPSGSSWFDQLFKSSPRPAWCQALTACELAPLQIKLNGQTVGENFLMPTGRTIWLRSQLPSIPVRPLKSAEMVSGEASAPYSAVLSFPPGDRAYEITIVNRGVSYTRSRMEFDLFGLGGVITVEHLGKNISHSDLAEDSSFAELNAAIRRDILTAMGSLDFKNLVWIGEMEGWALLALQQASELWKGSQRQQAMEMTAWGLAHKKAPSVRALADSLKISERIPFLKIYLRLLWHRSSTHDFHKAARKALISLGLPPDFEDFLAMLSPLDLREWFSRIVTRFPESWSLLKPVLQSTEDEELFREFLVRLEGPQDCSVWAQRAVLLEAHELVSQALGTDFRRTVELLLESAVLVAETPLLNWLRCHKYSALQAEVKRRLQCKQPLELLDQAQQQFNRYISTESARLQELQETLAKAHSVSLELEQKEVAQYIAVRRFLFGDFEVLPTIEGTGWDLHRKGCLAIMKGDLVEALSSRAGPHQDRVRLLGLESPVAGRHPSRARFREGGPAFLQTSLQCRSRGGGPARSGVFRRGSTPSGQCEDLEGPCQKGREPPR